MLRQTRLAKFTGKKAELMRKHMDARIDVCFLSRPDGSVEMWAEDRC